MWLSWFIETIKSIFTSTSGESSMTDTPDTSTEEPGRWKGWRTVGLNALIAVVGVLAATNWPDLIPPTYAGPIVAAIGFLNMYLRSITNTSVGKKV
jgi:hypothetical protein